MTSSFIKALWLAILATQFSCGGSTTFSGMTPDLSPKDEEEDPNNNDEGNPLGELEGTKYTITAEVRESKKKYEPVELMFVLDDSRSMQDNIAKLSNAMDNFFLKIGSAEVEYNARVITLSMLQNQMVDVPSTTFKSVSQVFGAEKPNYNRGALETLYKNAAFASSQSGHQALKNALQAVTGNTMIENEPGICLALDYLNWNMNSTTPGIKRFSDKQKLHVIFLSDEDNAEQYIERNASGAVVGSKDLICYQDRKLKNECVQTKYKKVRTNEKYSPTWSEPVTTRKHQYKVKYQNDRNFCMGQGVNDVNAHIGKLFYDANCVTQKLRCDIPSVKEYSCSATGLANHISTSNISSSYKYCNTPDQFVCNTMVDGQIVPVDKTLNEAIALMNLGVTCNPKGSALSKKFLTNANATKLGGYCSAITCSVSKYHQGDILQKDLNALVHKNCVVIEENNDAKTYFTLNKPGAKVLGVNVASPAPRLEDLNRPASEIANSWYCGPIGFTPPACVIPTFARVSDPTIINELTFEHAEAPQSDLRAQVARLKGIALDSITEVVYTELVSTAGVVRSLPVTTVAPAADDPMRSLPGFKENYTYTETNVDDPAGPLTREDCTVLTSEKREIIPTAYNVNNLVKELYPLMSITWHSIVNRDGKSCSGLSESNVSRGLAYERLSQLSQGNVADICDDKFDNFIVDLSNSIIEEVELSYNVPDEFKSKGVLKAVNKTTSKEMFEGKDWAVIDGIVRFEKTAIRKGDKVEIIFEK